ncbi:DUF4919 domain-containing protein [Flavobacterium covae]|uniref:DUF4919 domain-containing protein n=1 Tax=Flavobacterium covae TaxID=2906076 RepID=UPI000F4EA6BC|nr:DUF4919 domain-containing protein [Flavobacterium covae]
MTFKKIFILILFFFSFSNISYGQEFDYNRDFKEILKENQNKSSKLYFKTLLDRFEKNDSTLTNYEVIALQIGFTDNEYYKPYENLDKEREILKLIKDKEYEKAIQISDDFLKSNPLNLTALMEKGFAFMKLKKDNTEFHKEKTKKILRSIFWSGDGTIEKPYFVLSPIDSQTLIKYIMGGTIGKMGSGRDKNKNFVDILEMIKDEKSITKYFIIEHASKKLMEKLEKELK